MFKFDTNFSIFLNTFKNIDGVKIKVIFLETDIEISISFGDHLLLMSMYRKISDSIFDFVYTNTCWYCYKGKIQCETVFIGNNAKILDFWGLTTLHQFICKNFNIFAELSNDTNFEIIKTIKQPNVKKYQKVVYERKHKKLKPYYNSFRNEGIKDVYKKNVKTVKYPYISKFGYGLKKFDNKFFIFVDFENDDGIFDYRVSGSTLSELEQRIKKFCIGANTMIPKNIKNSKKSGNSYDFFKTKFSNPRQLNKKQIGKYIEEYKNDL
jgi:hypothetical protein